VKEISTYADDLKVVPYTFRAENQFLPLQYRSSADPNAYGNLFAELTDFFAADVQHPQAKAAA
jgi:glycerophosphoryl diester phosphodiesterase